MKDKKQKNARSDLSSLARSHSIRSNIKLTVIAVFATLFFGAFFAFLGLYAARSEPIYLAVSVGFAVLALLSLFALNRFRR